MSDPAPLGVQLRSAIFEYFRLAGLWNLLPWVAVITALVTAGTGCAAWAMRAELATDGHSPAVLPLLLMWPLWGIGLCLLWVVALSGTVHTPASRAMAGVAMGLGGAGALTLATCSGFCGGVYEAAPLAVAILGLGAGAAASAAGAAWAHLRYGASVAGILSVAIWAGGMAVVPVATFAWVRA